MSKCTSDLNLSRVDDLESESWHNSMEDICLVSDPSWETVGDLGSNVFHNS